MSLLVLLEPEASTELEDAALWYESQRAGLGFEFLAAVDRAVEHLTKWPDAGAPTTGLTADLPVRQVPAPPFPYHIAYLVTSGAIRILAFAHDHRRPGYWHPRTRG